MDDGSSSQMEITPINPVQLPVDGDVRDGLNVGFETALENIVEAVERKDDSKVRVIIREQRLAERLAELKEAAESGRLSGRVGERGLIKVLHHAAENGHEDLLKIVLADPDIDVNSVLSNSTVQEHDPCKGCTALILACRKGHTSIVKALLRKGADVHIYTRDGFTCLHMAAFSDHLDVVNVLLHGKITREQWETCDRDHMAVFCRKRKVSLNGRDESLEESFSRSRWALIERKSAIEKFTALHMAAGGVAAHYSMDLASAIEELTVLHMAHGGMVAILLEDIIAIAIEEIPRMRRGGKAEGKLMRFANEMVVCTDLDRIPGRSAYAAEFSRYMASAIEEFTASQLDAGVSAADYSVNIANKVEEFCAYYRARGGRAAKFSTFINSRIYIAKSILEALMSSVLVFYKVAKSLGAAYQIEGAPWHQFLLQVRHELHDLVDGVICREKILQSLAAYGNHDSGLVLRRELGNEYEGFVQGFVELVSFANAKDVMGRTALHHATSSGRGQFVKLLMWDSQFGSMASANIADLDGHTALHLASRMGYGKLVKELMNCSTPWPGRASSPPEREEAGQVQVDVERSEADGTQLDGLFDGKSYLQPNSTTSPSGRPAEILVAIGRDAKKQENNLAHERSGRSLLFIEVEKVFYYYMIIGARDVKGKRWRGESVWFEDRTGVTPLHYAVEHDHAHVVEFLILHPKTDVFWLASDGQSPWTIAYPLCRNEKHLHERTPIQLSLRGDRWHNSLIDMIDNCASNKEMWMPVEAHGNMLFEKNVKELIESMRFYQRQLLKRAIELALADENDLESKYRLQNLESQIIMALALRFQAEDVGEKDALDYNLTLLHVAAFYGLGQEIEALLMLKRYREHVNETETLTALRGTAFHFAVLSNEDAVAALLKEKTLNLSQQSEIGLTPMAAIQLVVDKLLARRKEMTRSKDKRAQDLSTLEYWELQTATGAPTVSLQGLQEIQRVLTENPLVVEKLYRDRQVFTDAANAILVGAALIASVTFGGFLQPPLGFVLFNAEQSSAGTQESFAAVEQHVSVRVFWAFNSLSFYSAIATVVAGGGAVLPTSRKSIEEEVRMVRSWLRGTSALLAISILCVLGAFTAAGFASLPNDFKYERNIVATGTIGLTLCVMVLILFFHRLFLSLDPLSPITIVISETFGWIYFFIQLAIVVCCLLILFVFKLPYAIFYLTFNGCNVYEYFWLEEPFEDFFSFVIDILKWEKIYDIYYRVWKEAQRRG